ncbi:MAG TPA: exosortase W [Vicinamibacterales bacterium]|nr:exosortase W [Vicinamibacterales bacterium]
MPSSKSQNVLIATVIAALLLCYAGVLATIVRAWSNNYLYSYGFAVPLISAYMLWARSAALRSVSRGPDYVLGGSVTALGVTILLIGHLGAMEAVEAVSIVVTALGATLLLFGRSVLRLAWFPIAYLILAVPIWDRAIAELQVPSQQLSAAIALRLLHLAQVPAIQDHRLLVLPNVTLEVLRECSGVNQLISIVTMALAASYVWLNGYLRRITLIAISVAVAYLSNGVRIALVGFLSYHQLSNGRIAVLHLAEGLTVSLVGYAVIFGCLSLLTPTKPAQPETDRTSGAAGGAEALRFPRVASLDFAIVAVLVGAALFRATFHPPGVHLTADFRTLPAQIDGWSADATEDSASGFRLAGADDELVRAYRHPSGETVRLYVGYHRYQIQGKELTDGRIGAGVFSTIRLPLTSESVEINRSLQTKAGNRAGLVFWYDVNGRILSNLYLAKGYTLWDGFTRGRTNAALVMIEWRGRAGEDTEGAEQRVLQFADAVVPLLRDYLPSLRDPREYQTPAVAERVTP